MIGDVVGARSPVRRVIVGHGTSPAARRALEHAAGLALRHGVPLYVIGVDPSPRPSPRLPLAPSRPEYRYAEERTRIAASFDQLSGGIPTGLDLRVAVTHGHPTRALSRLADRPDDILVLPPGSHTRARGRARLEIAA